jgi:exosortase D (VPLPA-CTERM-specific)
MVEYWGQSMAEGFLHDFEGWAVFMACTGILILEMWILAKIGKDQKSLIEVFGLDFPEPPPEDSERRKRETPATLFGAVALLGGAYLLSTTIEQREEIIPDRADFSGFPLSIGKWEGERDQLEQIYVDQLKFDDYIAADYFDGQNAPINFYVAYYGSQSKGESAHSPRSCLPGGGWRVQEFSQVAVDNTDLRVNRAVVRKGDIRQLVYYWFDGRSRNLTNEYMVKWYLFWDALTKRRTDGALVRLVTFVRPGEDIDNADGRLQKFAAEITDVLPEYVPG